MEDFQLASLTTVVPLWMHDVSSSYYGDWAARQLITHCLINPADNSYNEYIQGVLRCSGVIYVGSYEDVRAKLIKEVHDTGMGGHSGVRVTIKRLQQLFYWPNLSSEVKEYIKNCLVWCVNR